MKILYDNIIFSLQRYGGISVVWRHLVTRMMKKRGISIIEYDDATTNIIRRDMEIPGNLMTIWSSKWMKVKRYFNLRAKDAEKVIGPGKFIFHSSYYRTCPHPDAINVTTVHDFAYEYFVKNPIVKFLHCHQKHKAIRNSAHVACISENTRRDLLKFLPDVDPNKVSVIYNGVDRKYSPIEGAETENYALYVGNRDRYKNFPAIIEPLAACGVTLKIAGKPLTDAEKQMLDDAGMKYDFCGMVNDKDLNILYNHALTLIYPSQYEGFGLPVLEAQMAGCPVIACNVSSIPEVIGDKRMLVDAITNESIAEKIAMLRDPEMRKDIIRKGLENAERFSWDKMTDEYEKLYERILNEV